MCRDIDASKPQTILELGAGMGPVTSIIRHMMHPDSRLIALELDEELHAVATRRCPEVEVVHASADDIDAVLDDHSVESVDCMLSCLPTPSLPKETNRRVLDAWSRRCRSDFFTQITQIPWYYRSMYGKVFHSVQFKLVVRNLPPAGVYHCSGLRDDYSDTERLPGK